MRLYNLNVLNIEEKLRQEGHEDDYIEKHLWKYYYIITKLINKQILISAKSEYRRLCTKDLKNLLDRGYKNGKRRWLLYIIREELKDWGILRFYNTMYRDGDEKPKSSALYKINDEILEQGWHRVKVRLPEELSFTQEDNQQKLEGIYLDLFNMFSQVNLNCKDAESYLDWLLKYEADLKPKMLRGKCVDRKMNMQLYCDWKHRIEMFKADKLSFSVDHTKTGRIYSSLGNLPSELRPHLSINNEDINELDIKNSQPLLFIHLIDYWKQVNNIEETEDIKKYRDLCQAGEFYGFIKTCLLENGETIDEATFKQKFFSKIFFSTEKRNSKWRKIFNAYFPNVSKAVSYFKKGDYKKLAISLQNLEAEIIIKGVAKTIISKVTNPFFTIHDAIYFTEADKDLIINTVKEVYSSYNLHPSISVKRLILNENYKAWCLEPFFEELYEPYKG